MESDSETESLRLTPTNIAKITSLNLIPETSRKKYEAAYKVFMDWWTAKQATSFSEDVFMAYFGEISQKYKSSTLWAQYSMLKTLLKSKNRIDIAMYSKLRAFLKRQSHGYRPKKSKTFTCNEINKFIKEAPDQEYLLTKVALIMGVMGSCRMHELHQMKITNLKNFGSAVLVTIPDNKTNAVRRFTITGRFYEIFKKYVLLRPSNVNDSYFFLNYQKGKCTVQKVGINKFGAMGKQIAKYLKLPNPELYTGHCFRRSATAVLVGDDGVVTSLKRHGAMITEAYHDNCAQTTEMASDFSSMECGVDNKFEVIKHEILSSDEENLNDELSAPQLMKKGLKHPSLENKNDYQVSPSTSYFIQNLQENMVDIKDELDFSGLCNQDSLASAVGTAKDNLYQPQQSAGENARPHEQFQVGGSSCRCCPHVKGMFECLQMLLEKQTVQNSTLSQILMAINGMKNKIAEANNEQQTEEKSFFSTFDFPIMTQEQLKNVEDFLQDSHNFKRTKSELCEIVGNSLGDFLQIAISKLIHDDLLTSYTWEGKKGKSCFKSLKIAQLLLESLHESQGNVSEHISAGLIMNYIRNASERARRRLSAPYSIKDIPITPLD